MHRTSSTDGISCCNERLLQGTMPGALQALRLSDCLHSVTITESNRSGRAVAIVDLVPFGGPCSDQADGMQAWR